MHLTQNCALTNRATARTVGHVGRPMARAAVGPGGAFTGWAGSSRGTVPGAYSHLPPEPSPFQRGPTRIALVRLEILGAHAGADHPRALNPASPRMQQEPVELAAFSKSRSVPNIYDRSQLKRYMRPSVPFDLSEGHATFLDRDRNVPRPASLVPIFESPPRRGPRRTRARVRRRRHVARELRQDPRHAVEHARRLAHGG